MTSKYEDDQGPTLSQNFHLIKEQSQLPAKDLGLFLDWLVFNLIIGNNDSHSKNLSFLYDGSQLRLSPFYDLLSTVLYRGITSRFAFGFGKPESKQYYWNKLQDYHLLNTSKELGIHYSTLQKKLLSMCFKIEMNLVTTRNLLSDHSDLNVSTEKNRKNNFKENSIPS